MENSHKISSLQIYQISLELCLEIYSLLADFPSNEKFGIISQMKRASSSVGANIAEGYNRRTIKDQIKFLYQSKGSIAELIFFLELSFRLTYIDELQCEELIQKYTKLDVKIFNYITHLSK